MTQSFKKAKLLLMYCFVMEVHSFHKKKAFLKQAIEIEFWDRLFDISTGEDNIFYIKGAQSLFVLELSRHKDVKYQFLVDHVEKRDVMVHFVPTDEMVADVLTQNLGRARLQKLVKYVRMF